MPALSDSDAVALFVARARQLDPAFREVPGLPALCRQLDNLPLAIELAAARSSLFSVEELAERLGQSLELLKAGRGGEERHATLQAAIDWSYRLLPRRGAARLSRARDVPRRLHGGCARADRGTRTRTRSDRCSTRACSAGGMATPGRACSCSSWCGGTPPNCSPTTPNGERSLPRARCYFTDLTEQAFASITSFAAGQCALVVRDARRARQRARRACVPPAAGDALSLARTCAGEWFLWFFIGDPVEGAEWLRRALELGPPRHLLSPVENAYAAVLHGLRRGSRVRASSQRPPSSPRLHCGTPARSVIAAPRLRR